MRITSLLTSFDIHVILILDGTGIIQIEPLSLQREDEFVDATQFYIVS